MTSTTAGSQLSAHILWETLIYAIYIAELSSFTRSAHASQVGHKNVAVLTCWNHKEIAVVMESYIHLQKENFGTNPMWFLALNSFSRSIM